MPLPTTVRLPFGMAQLLYQRTAVTTGTIKLDSCVGDMEFVCQFMLNPVEKALPLTIMFRFNFHMS